MVRARARAPCFPARKGRIWDDDGRSWRSNGPLREAKGAAARTKGWYRPGNGPRSAATVRAGRGWCRRPTTRWAPATSAEPAKGNGPRHASNGSPRPGSNGFPLPWPWSVSSKERSVAPDKLDDFSRAMVRVRGPTIDSDGPAIGSLEQTIGSLEQTIGSLEVVSSFDPQAPRVSQAENRVS
jgi:hypothetical protein